MSVKLYMAQGPWVMDKDIVFLTWGGHPDTSVIFSRRSDTSCVACVRGEE